MLKKQELDTLNLQLVEKEKILKEREDELIS